MDWALSRQFDKSDHSGVQGWPAVNEIYHAIRKSGHTARSFCCQADWMGGTGKKVYHAPNENSGHSGASE